MSCSLLTKVGYEQRAEETEARADNRTAMEPVVAVHVVLGGDCDLAMDGLQAGSLRRGTARDGGDRVSEVKGVTADKKTGHAEHDCYREQEGDSHR